MKRILICLMHRIQHFRNKGGEVDEDEDVVGLTSLEIAVLNYHFTERWSMSRQLLATFVHNRKQQVKKEREDISGDYELSDINTSHSMLAPASSTLPDRSSKSPLH